MTISDMILLVVVLGSGLAKGAVAASTTQECASLVGMEDRRRGKGAFFSGCTTRSLTSGRGGCWSSLIDEQSGCQTCIVQDPGGSFANSSMWSESLFNGLFGLELDACPDSVAEEYGTPEGRVVTYGEMSSAACGDYWLQFEDSCYFKSSYLDSSINWEDADARCAAMGARLVSLETEAENDFVTHNLLWNGFLGESYTGLRKMWATAAWRWSNSLANYPPGDFDPLVSFQDWGEGLDASSSYPADGASCVEITPYAPKAWNPFSCEVNKQYVCERPLFPTNSLESLNSTVPPTAENDPFTSTATPAPTVSAATPLTPSPSDSLADGVPAPTWPWTDSGYELTAMPSGSPTGAPTGAPTGSPTASPTVDGSCADRLSEEDRRVLSFYDMEIYVDQSCVDIPVGGPSWCNLFGVGPECRICWQSCSGARSFLDDSGFAAVTDERINFCPEVDVNDFDEECLEEFVNQGTSRNLFESVRALLRGHGRGSKNGRSRRHK